MCYNTLKWLGLELTATNHEVGSSNLSKRTTFSSSINFFETLSPIGFSVSDSGISAQD